MDPLSAADVVFNHAERIMNFVAAAKTNTKKCDEVLRRVERLREVAEKIRRHPDQVLDRQIENVDRVMDNANEAAKKYCGAKKGLRRALRFIRSSQINKEFADLNASLDSVLEDLMAAMNANMRGDIWEVQTDVKRLQMPLHSLHTCMANAHVSICGQVEGVHNHLRRCMSDLEARLEERISGLGLIQQMARCAAETLRMHLPDHYISLDGRVEAVKSILQESKEKVVALVGMGGVGKTTLAKAVYNDMWPCQEFHSIGWVTVGRDADLLQCLKQVWRQLVSYEWVPCCSCTEDLKTELLNALEGRRVLLVLDDVWTVDALQTLRVTASNSGSRLLMTARNSNVAVMVGAEVYKVGLLDSKQSRELFCSCAFGVPQVPSCKLQYSKVVEEMVSHCAQLPLALHVLGSMAKGYQRMEEWESSARKLHQSRSLGAAYEDGVLSLLQASYDDLDHAQKRFFFCLVCHPEDSLVRVSELVEQWAVCQEPDDEYWDREDRYLDGYAICMQLVDRSLFMLHTTTESGEETDLLSEMSCHMHDLLREMGLQLARGDGRDVAARERLLFPGAQQIAGRTVMAKALSMCGSAMDSWPEGFLAPCLEVFVSRGSGLMKVPAGLMHSRRLRLLDLSYCPVQGIEANMEQLCSLEVLRLDGCYWITELPCHISSLKQLTVLSLRECENLWMLPDCFGELGRLHSLYIGCPRLQSLPPSIVEACSMTRLELEGCQSLVSLPLTLNLLKNLRQLKLAGCSNLEFVPDSLGSMWQLQILSTHGCTSLTQIPSTISQLEKLQTLDLGCCSSLVQIPEGIGSLQLLQTLNLGGCTCLESIPDSIDSLKHLRTLNLHLCTSLTYLPNSMGRLEHLETLDIGSCSNLLEIPDSIGLLGNLLVLDLGGCTQLAHIPHCVGSLAGLQTLNLSWCSSLTHVPDSIGFLGHLVTLDLGECEGLTSIPDSIGCLERLQVLDMRDCGSLMQIPETVGSLGQLRTLDLGGCLNLQNIPESVGLLSRLETLNLRMCSSLSHIPDGVGSLARLRTLDLGGCWRVSRLPRAIGHLSQLQTLDLGGCWGLREIPDTVTSLGRLETLDLSRCCYLGQIPEGVGSLSQLRRLYLGGCESLTRIPDGVVALSHLRTLGLMWCTSLAYIPEGLGSLAQLQPLDLEGCSSLTHLPDCVASVGQLDAEFW